MRKIPREYSTARPERSNRLCGDLDHGRRFRQFKKLGFALRRHHRVDLADCAREGDAASGHEVTRDAFRVSDSLRLLQQKGEPIAWKVVVEDDDAGRSSPNPNLMNVDDVEMVELGDEVLTRRGQCRALQREYLAPRVDAASQQVGTEAEQAPHAQHHARLAGEGSPPRIPDEQPLANQIGEGLADGSPAEAVLLLQFGLGGKGLVGPPPALTDRLAYQFSQLDVQRYAASVLQLGFGEPPHLTPPSRHTSCNRSGQPVLGSAFG